MHDFQIGNSKCQSENVQFQSCLQIIYHSFEKIDGDYYSDMEWGKSAVSFCRFVGNVFVICMRIECVKGIVSWQNPKHILLTFENASKIHIANVCVMKLFQAPKIISEKHFAVFA